MMYTKTLKKDTTDLILPFYGIRIIVKDAYISITLKYSPVRKSKKHLAQCTVLQYLIPA